MHNLFTKGVSYYYYNLHNSTLTTITVGGSDVSVKHRNSYVYEFDSKYFILKSFIQFLFIST